MTAPVTTYAEMLPTRFTPSPVNPSPNGLVAATQWLPESGPTRWLDAGVEIRPVNYGGAASFGVWAADWCAQLDDLTPADRKVGLLPQIPEPFAAMTTWSADQCDLTEPSQSEVRERAAQIFRLEEPNAIEREFAVRLLADADTIVGVADIVEAVSTLETELGRTNTQGVIHASIGWAAWAAQANILIRTGGGFTTPMGHRWVFGGGYADGLGDTLIATSQTFGWRGEVRQREAIDASRNEFVAIVERSLVVGYEQHIGAVLVTP